MSKEFPDDHPTFYTPLSTEYSTPFSSEVDLTMSRRELDPTLRGDRDRVPEPSTGLLGTLEPGFEMAGNGMPTGPEDEDSRNVEQSPQESRGGLGKGIPEPVLTSTGFRNSVKLSWEGSLGPRREETPWRHIPGSDILGETGQDEGPWRQLPGRGPVNSIGGAMELSRHKDQLEDGTWRCENNVIPPHFWVVVSLVCQVSSPQVMVT